MVKKNLLQTAALMFAAINTPVMAATIIYQNDFESPSGFVSGFHTGPVTYADVSQQSVNTLYGSSFGQTFTVETLNVSGATYSGAGVGNDYALGMLESAQPDLLWLTFDVSGFDFVNVQMDISAIDLNGNDSVTLVTPGVDPVFEFKLFNGGATASTAPVGALLDSIQISGNSTTQGDRYLFDWTNHLVALSTLGNTSGTVTLQLDLLSGGYASFDNLTIASSDEPGDVSPVPVPAAFWLFGSALGLMGWLRRKTAN